MNKKFDVDEFIFDLLGAIIAISFIVVLICGIILIVLGFTGKIEPDEIQNIANALSIYKILGFCS